MIGNRDCHSKLQNTVFQIKSISLNKLVEFRETSARFYLMCYYVNHQIITVELPCSGQLIKLKVFGSWYPCDSKRVCPKIIGILTTQHVKDYFYQFYPF